MTTDDAKTYLSKREIPRLFESLMTGLMFNRPSDHINYLIECLEKTKDNSQVSWNMFVEKKRTKTPLPPITPENGKRPESRGRSFTTNDDPRPLNESRGTPLPPIGQQDQADAPVRVTSLPDIPIVLVMGGPGSGKLTQIQKLLHHHTGWVHISMGDLMRKEVAHRGSASEKWKMVGELMSQGEMVSEEDACALFIDQIQQHSTAEGFLVEGYPRDEKQLDDFERTVGRIDAVFLIDCEEVYLSQRLLKRGATGDRPDDNIQAVRKRLIFFKEKTLPVIKKLDDQGKLHIFEGSQDEDWLSQQMIAIFDKILYGKDIAVPMPPKTPKSSRGRSPRLKTPETEDLAVKTTYSANVDFIEPEPVDLAAAEINLKDTGRKQNMPDCPIILVTGGPGSGKGTQCKKIVERYPKVVHLSMGDILRTEISTKGTADEKWGMISTLLQQGEMAPEEVTVELLIENLQKHTDAQAFIIEGYPRDARQVEEFNKNIGGLSFAILLDCDEYYMQQRLILRGSESGRPDDNLTAIGKRISFFKHHTLPVLKHYDDEAKLTVIIGDRDEQDIFFEIAQTLDFALFGRKSQALRAIAMENEEAARLREEEEEAEKGSGDAKEAEDDDQAGGSGQQDGAGGSGQQDNSETKDVNVNANVTETEDGEKKEEEKEEEEVDNLGINPNVTQTADGDEEEEEEDKGDNLKEVVEEEMVAETSAVTGGEEGNKEYSEQLDALDDKEAEAEAEPEPEPEPASDNQQETEAKADAE